MGRSIQFPRVNTGREEMSQEIKPQHTPTQPGIGSSGALSPQGDVKLTSPPGGAHVPVAVETTVPNPAQRVSRLAIVFCIIAAALLGVGIYVLLNLQLSVQALARGVSFAGGEDASRITAQMNGVQLVFAYQLAQTKFVVGVIFGAFLVALSCALFSQGFYSASQERNLDLASVPPSMVELRERRKWIYFIPGVILAVCSTLVLSLSLFARLPGDPLVRPPNESPMKTETTAPASPTPTPVR